MLGPQSWEIRCCDNRLLLQGLGAFLLSPGHAGCWMGTPIPAPTACTVIMSTLATMRALAWMHLSPSQIHVDILALQVTLGDGAFGEQLDHAGGRWRSRESPLASRGDSKKTTINEEGAPTRLPAPCSWTFRPPETQAINFSCLLAACFMALCDDSPDGLRQRACEKSWGRGPLYWSS